jgi:hypothetical protein
MKNLMTYILLFILGFTSCKQNKNDYEKVINKFQDWRSIEVSKGNLWDSCPPIEQVSEDKRWAISKDFKATFEDINDDGMIDGLLTFQANDCLQGNAAIDESRKAVLIISNKKEQNFYYDSTILKAIIYSLSTDIELRVSKHYRIDFENITEGPYSDISGDCSIWTDDNAHCCPSIKGIFTYSLNSKEIDVDYYQDINYDDKTTIKKTLFHSHLKTFQ